MLQSFMQFCYAAVSAHFPAPTLQYLLYTIQHVKICKNEHKFKTVVECNVSFFYFNTGTGIF
jgi:hypothetical protein